MKRPTIIPGFMVLAGVILAADGCSSSSSSPDSTAKIDGMTPAEYREKAEQSRQIAAPVPKTKGSSRRP